MKSKNIYHCFLGDKVYVLLVFCLLFVSNRTYAQKVDYPKELKTLHQNVMNYHLAIPINTDYVDELLKEMKPDGSWSSIDYTNKVRGGWPVKDHLKYLQDVAIVYQQKGSAYYHNKDISKKIHTSLNYWLINDFLSTNWWDQHIGAPELLAPILFLMEDELTPNQLKSAFVLLKRAKIKMSGQNKVWLSGNVLLTSLLQRNIDSVAIASKSIQGELQISKGVGLKNDGSYHEHGALLQFGNYGLSFLEDMIKWSSILNNTPFQFKEDKITVLRNYVLDGQQWVLWKKKFDVSASGRQIFMNEPVKKYLRIKDCIEKMKVIDPLFKTNYDSALDSETLIGDKYFYRSDFHVHRSKDFYFSIRMSSKRVIGTESVNGENLKGYYQGDGTALLQQSGEEYFNISPFWDWKKIPGTTIVQNDKELPVIKAWDFKTNSNFVGGVSNGKNGIAVMEYNRDSLKANKSWFMFGDNILCLGSNINATTKFNVTTSINQLFLNGAIDICKDDVIVHKLDKNVTLEPDWILHDNTGYLFPKGGNVKIETKFLEGTWSTISSRERPVILTEDILRLWLDHGSNPVNKSYAYVLVPNSDKEKLQYLTKNQPFNFVNEVDLQSAISSEGNTAGIVFYKEGKSTLFGGITANQPCVLLLEKTSEGIEVSVSDPSQEIKNIHLTFEGRFKGDFSNIENNKTQLYIKLPQEEEAGKSVSVFLKKE